MRSLNEVKEEKTNQVIRAFYDSGIPLRKDEVYLLANKAAAIFESGLIEVSTAIPRISEDRKRIQAYNGKSVDGYHLIHGVFTRITQIFNADGTVNYYTDGKKELLDE
jgi:hypothetical protein